MENTNGPWAPFRCGVAGPPRLCGARNQNRSADTGCRPAARNWAHGGASRYGIDTAVVTDLEHAGGSCPCAIASTALDPRRERDEPARRSKPEDREPPLAPLSPARADAAIGENLKVAWSPMYLFRRTGDRRVRSASCAAMDRSHRQLGTAPRSLAPGCP